MDDLISRRALCEYALNQKDKSVTPNDIMRFPSAQPEIIHCKDCKYWNDEFEKDKSTCWLPCMSMTTHRNWYCGSAERREE